MDEKLSSSCLTHTSRVSAKILEYYMKFGKDRDLEKFMRLHSPADSTTQSSSCCVEAWTKAGNLCSLFNENVVDNEDCGDKGRPLHDQHKQHSMFASQSMPNIEMDDDTRVEDKSEEAAKNEHIIPIRLEYDVSDDNKGNSDRKVSKSENTVSPKTPKTHIKNFEEVKLTIKTPESVAKTHRRLEWDSLADIGYKKSKSTGNISILERTLLRELFQDCSPISELNLDSKSMSNSSQSRKLPGQCLVDKTFTKNGTQTGQNFNYVTPPIACSTLVLECQSYDIQNRESPKQLPTVLASEKSVQTSLRSNFASTQSQDIPVSLASLQRTASSALGSSATPSSFEYRTSRSSQSNNTLASPATTSNSANEFRQNCEKNADDEDYLGQDITHPFVKTVKDIMAQRCKLSKEQQELKHSQNVNNRGRTNDDVNEEIKLQHLHNTWKSMVDLEQNKENTTTTSILGNSPKLDMGVQLICALIEAKSLDHTHKKRLVRDIAKRISHLASASEVNTLTSSSSQQPSHIDGNSHDNVKIRKPTARQNICKGDSVPNKSKNDSNVSNSNKLTLAGSAHESENRYMFPTHYDNTLTECDEASKFAKNLSKSSSLEQKSQQFVIENLQPTDTQAKSVGESLLGAKSGTMESSIGKSLKGPHSQEATLSTTSTQSSSHDITTQKQATPNRGKINNSNETCADDITMQEWLNPMTQSEMDYEDKKRKLIDKSKKDIERKKKSSASSSSKSAARQAHLEWVASEIERLQNLKHLLLSDDDASHSTTISSDPEKKEYQKLTKESKAKGDPKMLKEAADKLYDTVYTEHEKSSGLSTSAEHLVNEIELIIDDSNTVKTKKETVVNRNSTKPIIRNLLNTKSSVSLEHLNDEAKKAKAKIYSQGDLPKLFSPGKSSKKREKEKARITQSTELRKQQRSKIDTPVESCGDSVSVCSFVHQRKREFLEHYKNLKLRHYESLKQKENLEQIRLANQQKYLQHRAFLNAQREMHSCGIDGGGDADHYSVPNTLNRCVYPTYAPKEVQGPDQHHIHHYHHHHPQYLPAQEKVKSSETLINDNATRGPQAPPPVIQTAHEFNQKSQSSKDALDFAMHQCAHLSGQTCCLSSEISVPMGSHIEDSSLTTTTHQYDDVAAMMVAGAPMSHPKNGIGVQTGESLKRTKPIYKTQPPQTSNKIQSENAKNGITMRHDNGLRISPITTAPNMKTACIQVQPKNIAYIITYKKEKRTFANSDDYQKTNVLSDAAQHATLREHLERAKPKFCAQYKRRKALLNQIQALRQEREREMRNIVENASFNSLDRRLQNLPPPAIRQIRIFPTKQMKAMTNKRVAFLPEVVAKQHQEREERRRQSNRLMRDIFNRRLQQRVRKGKLSLNHSRTVI